MSELLEMTSSLKLAPLTGSANSLKEQVLPELQFNCMSCKSRLAAIFQDEGEFCLECWQVITHPNVESYR
jgi:hypothetical protein